ncbi:MAG: lipoprotein [Burkholderiales bacterium]|jgi:predicted small lipoprotein YifL|nr:lipoprotein [Burkholderiales bacterium]
MMIEIQQASSPAVSEKAPGRASRFFLRLGCFALLGCFLGGCGIKGPLTLPQETSAASVPAPEEATK